MWCVQCNLYHPHIETIIFIRNWQCHNLYKIIVVGLINKERFYLYIIFLILSYHWFVSSLPIFHLFWNIAEYLRLVGLKCVKWRLYAQCLYAQSKKCILTHQFGWDTRVAYHDKRAEGLYEEGQYTLDSFLLH